MGGKKQLGNNGETSRNGGELNARKGGRRLAQVSLSLASAYLDTLPWMELWIHLGFSGHCIQGHFKDQNTPWFNPEMHRGLSRLPVSQFSEMIGIGSFAQNWTLGDAQLHISEI